MSIYITCSLHPSAKYILRQEISLLAALIQRRHAPEPPAPLPAEETSPEVPASHAASELLTSAMQTRTTSRDADPRGRTERRMERTQQTERVISRSSDWSAQVAEELEPPTLSHSSSSRSTGLRQSQADSFRAVVESLGSKLAYRKAMDLMWNYDLEAASVLLAPWQSSNLWHASGAAECFMLRTILTGRKSDALSTLELIKVAEALSEGVGSTGSTLAHEVCNAELLLMRSLLQIILGFRFRALYNLRQCWYAYYRLEQFLEDDASMRACTEDVDCVMTYDDLRGRILFGLGFFYMATSLVPTSLVPLVRLAGFLMHRQRGKTYLFECVERALGSRCSIAAILLAMYHLDLEPATWHGLGSGVQLLQSMFSNVLCFQFFLGLWNPMDL